MNTPETALKLNSISHSGSIIGHQLVIRLSTTKTNNDTTVSSGCEGSKEAQQLMGLRDKQLNQNIWTRYTSVDIAPEPVLRGGWCIIIQTVRSFLKHVRTKPNPSTVPVWFDAWYHAL